MTTTTNVWTVTSGDDITKYRQIIYTHRRGQLRPTTNGKLRLFILTYVWTGTTTTPTANRKLRQFILTCVWTGKTTTTITIRSRSMYDIASTVDPHLL